MSDYIEQKKLSREEREALRGAVESAVSGASADSATDAAGRVLPFLLPDPAAKASKSGIRTAREVLHEAAETLDRVLGSNEVARAVGDALWASELPEARVVAARLLAERLSTEEAEEEATREKLGSLVRAAPVPAVTETLADSLSRAMEKGASDFWSRAFVAWSSDPDPRLRALGPSAFAHLFGRGKAPERLFDALQLARRLFSDADPAVRRALLALLASAGRRQGAAVERFLSGFDADDRSDVKKLVAEVRKRLGVRG